VEVERRSAVRGAGAFGDVRVPRAERDDHVAPGRDPFGERGHHLAGVTGREEMQDAGQHQADGLADVDLGVQGRVGQDRSRVAHVARHDNHSGVLGQDGAGVADNHRVVVDVGDLGGRLGVLGHVVRVQDGGQARAHVDELGDALPGHVGDGPPQELPVLLGDLGREGIDLQQPLGQVAIGREVVFPAEPVVVDAGDVRLGGIEWLQGSSTLPWRAEGSTVPGQK
jgi:hypothetical protein